MIVRFYGHSCFLLYSKKKSRILTDPFSEKLRYFMPPLTCEIVVISHEHQNHNAVWRVIGQPYLVKRTNPGACEIEVGLPLTEETFIFKGIPTYHDEFQGRRQGPNTVFVWEMDKLQICHLGDLGHMLTQDQIKNIGEIDVLFLPVGGNRVLNPNIAAQTAKALKAKVIFPMHFNPHPSGPGPRTIDTFLELMPSVESLDSNQCDVSALPHQPTVMHLAISEGDKVGR